MNRRKEWIGMRIYAFADEASGQVDGQIAAMRRNGLKGLEIRGVDGQSIADISLEKAREVKRKMDDAGLMVWSMGSPIGKISIADEDFSLIWTSCATCWSWQTCWGRRTFACSPSMFPMTKSRNAAGKSWTGWDRCWMRPGAAMWISAMKTKRVFTGITPIGAVIC